MRDEYEMELVELFERAELAEPEWQDDDDAASKDYGEEIGYGSTIASILAAGREAAEARLAARDMRITARAWRDPARIAADMKRRVDYLRSRPMRGGFHRYERQILGELEAIGGLAEELERRRQLGEISDVQAAREAEGLSDVAYAVRGRFADLLTALAEPWPSRPKLDAEARRLELAEIEAFLARKKAGR